MRRFSPLLLLFFLCACGTVHSPSPFGPVPRALEPADWDGTWCAAEEIGASRSAPVTIGDETACATITVVDPAGGIFDALLSDHEGPPELHRIHAREVPGEGAPALLWLEQDGEFQLLARIRWAGHSLVLWSANAAAFGDEATSGRLPGRAAGDDVWLGPIDAPAAAQVAADERGRFFDWRQPMTFVRVTE